MDWVCRSAGGGVCKSTKTAFANFAYREKCLKCGVSKGQCNAGDVPGGPPSRSTKGDAALAKSQKETAALRKQLKELEAKQEKGDPQQ